MRRRSKLVDLQPRDFSQVGEEVQCAAAISRVDTFLTIIGRLLSSAEMSTHGTLPLIALIGVRRPLWGPPALSVPGLRT